MYVGYIIFVINFQVFYIQSPQFDSRLECKTQVIAEAQRRQDGGARIEFADCFTLNKKIDI